jgi:DHA3 family macrolide efflux protein-like MFS transporter
VNESSSLADSDDGSSLPVPAPYRKFDRLVGKGERSLFRLLAKVAPGAMELRRPRFQRLLVGKLLSDTARDAMRYASVVATVAASGSALQSSMLAAAALLPAALFGIYAGGLVDSLPRRVALAAAYGLSGLSALLIPALFGTEFLSMIALLFVVATFSELAIPAENATIPMLAKESEIASANSFMGISSSLGTAIGTAMLAPVLLKLLGVESVFYLAGILMLFAASRALHIRSRGDTSDGAPRQPKERAETLEVLRWIFSHPTIGTMVVVWVLVSVSHLIMTALAPVYVQQVLATDPANAVFVMGPSGLAMVLSIAIAPFVIKLLGERGATAVGLGFSVVALVALGLVDRDLAVVVDPANPFRVAGLVGLDLSATLRTAMFLSVPFGLGAGLTENAVKTYFNRRVPLEYQGRTFAAKSTLQSVVAIVPLVAVAGAASVFGVSLVLVALPLVIYSVLLLLLHISRRFGVEAIGPATIVAEILGKGGGEPESIRLAPSDASRTKEGERSSAGTTPGRESPPHPGQRGAQRCPQRRV